jgi:hypothetical protein
MNRREESLLGSRITTFVDLDLDGLVDLDLDGLVDVGSTTRVEQLDQGRPGIPIAHIVQFFHRSTRRADQSVACPFEVRSICA